MKLFLLWREGNIGYDEADSFVVRAESEESARELASQKAGDEGGLTWLQSDRSFCSELTVDGIDKVIIRSFARW